MSARRPRTLLAALLSVSLLSGCVQSELDKTRAEMEKTNASLGEARAENKRLNEQVARQDERMLTLLSLGDKRLDKLYVVQKIDLGSYTGAITTEGKEYNDAVKVFLLPMDQDGSILKASGSVKIQLFDLAAPPEQNLVGECQFGVDEVRKHWYGGFGSYQYSFVCPWKEGIQLHHELTVRVEFIDYLTGKKFSAQKTVEVKPVPATTQGS